MKKTAMAMRCIQKCLIASIVFASCTQYDRVDHKEDVNYSSVVKSSMIEEWIDSLFHGLPALYRLPIAIIVPDEEVITFSSKDELGLLTEFRLFSREAVQNAIQCGETTKGWRGTPESEENLLRRWLQESDAATTRDSAAISHDYESRNSVGCTGYGSLNFRQTCILRAYINDQSSDQCAPTGSSNFSFPANRMRDTISGRGLESVYFYNDDSWASELSQAGYSREWSRDVAAHQLMFDPLEFLRRFPRNVEELADFPFAESLNFSGQRIRVPDSMRELLESLVLIFRKTVKKDAGQELGDIQLDFDSVPEHVSGGTSMDAYRSRHVFWFEARPARMNANGDVVQARIILSGALLRTVFFSCISEEVLTVYSDLIIGTGGRWTVQHSEISRERVAEYLIDCFIEGVGFALAHEMAHIFLSRSEFSIEPSEFRADCGAIWILSFLEIEVRPVVLEFYLTFAMEGAPRLFGDSRRPMENQIMERIISIQKLIDWSDSDGTLSIDYCRNLLG